MKKMLVLFAASLLPLLAHASCDELKSQIDDKLKAKNVPNYTLDIVAADQADGSKGKVVGSCEGDSKKIVYTRGAAEEGDAGDKSMPASASSSGK